MVNPTPGLAEAAALATCATITESDSAEEGRKEWSSPSSSFVLNWISGAAAVQCMQCWQTHVEGFF